LSTDLGDLGEVISTILNDYKKPENPPNRQVKPLFTKKYNFKGDLLKVSTLI
jgi:hypothetical protein